MRITFGMLTGNVISGLMRSSDRLIEAQNRASSGKRIQSPSDDVCGISRSLALRSAISQLEQLSRNSGIVRSQLSVTSTSLDSIVRTIQEVRRLALAAATSTQTPESRTGIAAQLDALSDQLSRLANTQYGGKYIFSGSFIDKRTVTPTNAGTPPFTYDGDNTVLSVQVAPGIYITANVTGAKLFNFNGTAMPAEPDCFSAIAELKERVLSGSSADISACVDRIDAQLANIIAIGSQVGGTLSTLDSADDSTLNSKTQLQKLLSETEDVDLAQAVVELRTRENIYQAAVAVASRLLNVSLADYLK